MKLEKLYLKLAEVFESGKKIEADAAAALQQAASAASYNGDAVALPDSFIKILKASNSLPVCKLIAEASLPWKPPTTSNSRNYLRNSHSKLHVELVGPAGLVESTEIRLGLYGMHPNSEYGIRTHLAEEIYVMLAGESFWKVGEGDYQSRLPGERSYHPSMIEHANYTTDSAFMSIYVWTGDISTDSYIYNDS